jgi:hypothetical protein
MARHRIPLAILAVIAWPAVAQAQAESAAVGIIPAPPDPLGTLAARQRAENARCGNDDPDGVVVCGRVRRVGGGYRVPWQPEPGARVRLVAGEPPSGAGAMGAGGCLRLCLQPVMINLLDPRAIARGIDRILGGD